MLPFCLYFITGVITGFHVYTLLALTWYGEPLNLLELVSLLGSLLLLISAWISLFRPNVAARVALIACLLIWSFYAPATANLVRHGFHRHKVVSCNHEYGWDTTPSITR
ncbi:MAG: hypothetical protein WCD47_05565 [Candidatus Sulfotelmatobacter sp.]